VLAHSGQCAVRLTLPRDRLQYEGQKAIEYSTRSRVREQEKGRHRGLNSSPLEFLGELGTEFARPAKFSRFGQNCGVIITAGVVKFVA